MSASMPSTSLPLAQSRRTKIVATVGPATFTRDGIYQMVEHGVDGFRLNFSHGTYDERSEQIQWIRSASRKFGRSVAIIQDLQGPKIRLGDFGGEIKVRKGQELSFIYKGAYEPGGPIPTQYDLSKKVSRGERIFLYDGRVRATVTSVSNSVVRARAENSGTLTERKGINLPDTNLSGHVITAKDKKDIAFGSTLDIDYVALSFIQSEKDINTLRRLLNNHNSDALIIAKIETKQAMENLDAIVDATDAVMVARGDLAIETEIESVPVAQRVIIGKCLEKGKTSIVATQMLGSMTDHTEPTRAEVSDVATAVIVGADAVMLSDETANGKFPFEAIEMMKKIVIYTQKNTPLKPVFNHDPDTSIQGSISAAVITLAHQVGATAIIAETKTGRTARTVAAHRPSMPIVTVTSTLRTANQLAIVYGGNNYVRPASRIAGTKLTAWLRQRNVLSKGDVVVITSGKDPGVAGGTDTIKVRRLD